MAQAFQVHVPVLIKPAALNAAAYNPRKISPEKYEALRRNIVEEGFLEPIVVQKDGLKIIGGHQRVRAVKELSIEAGVEPPQIPCVVLDIDDRRAKKLNIKLNNLRGEFEARLLGELLVDLYEDKPIDEPEAFDLGFALEDAAKFIRIVDPEILPEVKPESLPEADESLGKLPTLSLEFDSVALRDQVKKLLQERTKLEKKKTGSIVAESLGLTKKVPTRKKKTAA